MKILLAVVFVITLLTQPAFCKEREIRSKSILLPISHVAPEHRIEYVTEAYGGCYHWSTNEPTVLNVQGIVTSNNCQSKAVLRLQHDGGWVSPLSISAKDRDSEDIVKANVRLARVASIEILTKFRVMNVGQVVEFYIVGHDAEHNTFSSLKGFKFEWDIVQDSAVVQRVSIRDSGIHQETNYRKDLETLGHQTDMFVLKALKIGQLRLRAKLREPRYEGIQAEIIVSVQERFEIDPPSPVYLLANSKFKFSLVDSKYQKIALPNVNYRFGVSNKEYTVSSDLEMKTPILQGQTVLTVEDTRTVPPYANQVDVFSYRPDQIVIKARDYIIAGQEEPFAVEFYSNKRLLKGNVDYDLSVSELTLNKDKMTVVGNTKKLGVIRVRYGLLSAEKTVVINLPLKSVLLKDEIVLPVGQTFQLNVLGGSQDYLFRIDPPSIADVDSSGVVSTKLKGKATIYVTDSKDSGNTLQILLSVEAVKSLRSLEERKEVPLGEEGDIIVLGEANSGRPFTQCDSLVVGLDETINSNVKFVRIDRNFLALVNKLRTESTSNSELKAALNRLSTVPSDFDFVKLFSKYVVAGEITADRLNELINRLNNYGVCIAIDVSGLSLREQANRLKLEGSSVVSPQFNVKVFQPLQTLDIDPNVMDIVMTPKSSYNWKLRGGPSRWEASSEPIVTMNGERVKDLNSFTVECGDRIESIIYKARILNFPTSKLLRPRAAETNITINCRFPSSIRLTAPNTTLDRRSLYLTKSQPFELKVQAYDALNRRFLNNSNLEYVWELDGVKRITGKPHFTFDITPGSKHLVRVLSSRIEGSPALTFDRIKDEIEVQTKKSFFLLSNGRAVSEVTLLLHPFNKLHVDAKEGSQHFTVLCISEIVRCVYQEGEGRIEITPVKVGETTVRVADNYVYGSEVHDIIIHVVDPVRLLLKANATLLEEGSFSRIDAIVYGQNDREIDYHQFKYLNLRISTDCIAKEHDRTSSSVVYQLKHKGTCRVYGHIDGVSRAGEPTHRLDSENTIQLEVYKRFTANMLDLKESLIKGVTYLEANMNIALGCNAYLTFSGGPEHKLDVKYVIKPTGIVAVQQHDDRTYEFKSLAEGDTYFRLTLVQNNTIISQTNIKILVRSITGIEIMGLVNGRRDVHTGATIRLVPKIMIGDRRPADSFCPLTYEWKSADKDIVAVGEWSSNDERYSNSGINITALSSGTALVELVARTQGSNKEVGGSKAILKVVDVTDVDVPTYIDQPITSPSYLILPPHSSYHLPADHLIRLLAPCDKSIHVHHNTIETGDERRSAAVQITTSGEEAPNYLTVVVTKIHSVVIENPAGVLSLQVDSKARVRFYVQDHFGRLFPNNVHGVHYVLRVSNPHILSAEISEDRNFIELKGINNGSCQLVLSVDGLDDYDVIPIRVGHLVRPSSPIYVHEGGIVQFEVQEGTGDWESSSSSVVSIDSKTGRAVALRVGSADVMFKSGMTLRSKVNVLQATSIVSANGDLGYEGLTAFNITYHIIWRQPPEELRENLNNPHALINHNLVFKCEAKAVDWFEVYGGFATQANGTQVPYCTVRTRKNPPASKIPANLVLTATLSSNETNFKLMQVFSYPYHFEFFVPERDRAIQLNPEYPTANITIDTNEELLLVDTDQDYVKSHYNRELRQQVIRIDLTDHGKFLRSNVRVRNPITGQQESIAVRFDPAGRGKPATESTWSHWNLRWTDYIVGIMIVVLILALLNWRADQRPKLL